MSKALYRKYRSRSLAEVMGQSHVTDILSAAFARDNVSHAYLLTGPRGVGKTSIARIIAHAINKLDYSDDPNLDIIEIDAASNRRIDDIRDLREKVHIAPLSAAYKVYIIDEVHMLTGESFNALLKTLEEPPAHVVFILATTELHKVPATIISRTQRFHLRPAEQGVVAEHLGKISKKENIEIDEAALQLIAKHGGGSFRDSVSLLDQLAQSGQAIDASLVEQTLGLLPAEQIDALTGAVIKHNLKAVLACIKQATNEGMSLTTVTDQLIMTLSEAAPTKPELYLLINQLLDVKRSHAPEIKLLAIVAGYAKPATSHTMAAQAPTLSVKKDVATLRREAPLKKDIQSQVEPQAETVKPEVAAPQQLPGQTREFEWEKVIAALQTYNPSLHSVLRRATYHYDGSKLVLKFQYVLHRKKLENQKYRSALVKIIRDVCGDCPEIVLSDSKADPLDTEVASVADIMGGGDSVHANI